MYLVKNWYLIYELTKRDLAAKYENNFLGLAWIVIEPLAMMLIFWLVFGVGLRGGSNVNIPFVCYLITGLSVFIFFSETVNQAMNSIKENSFLLEKVDFKLSILPFIKVLSGLTIHAIVVAISAFILMANKIFPHWYWIQTLYFTFALVLLIMGIGWITASISLFIPDMNSIIRILLRFLIYLTPVFWQLEIFPQKLQFIFKLNPLYYIVIGYRNSLIYHVPFWDDWTLAVYYWSITLFFLLSGITVFRKLQPYFNDVI